VGGEKGGGPPQRKREGKIVSRRKAKKNELAAYTPHRRGETPHKKRRKGGENFPIFLS